MAAETEKPGFEPADISRPWLVGGSILAFFLFAIVLMGILLAVYLGVAPAPKAPEVFPKPELQPHPQADLKKYMKAQQKRLDQAGWIDKKSGIAAIPIDKAMRIIAGRGASAFAPLPEASSDGQPQGGQTP
jgi:hypothetical protein